MTYQEIASDKNLLIKTLADCYFTADNPQQKWEDARRFISLCLDHPGSLLDIGCANGFLIKSLEYWSGQKIAPFGIDVIAQNIQNAQKLFPEYQNNFQNISYDSFLLTYPVGFPYQFDYLIWSFWDDKHLIEKREVDFLLEHTKDNGKLIITFYPDDSREPTDTIGNISNILQIGYRATNIKNNVPHRNEQLVVIQK